VTRVVALGAACALLAGISSTPAAFGRASKHPRIAFVRSGDNRRGHQIWTTRSDGSHKRRLTRGHIDSNPAWSPDGRLIAFHRSTLEDTGIYVMSSQGDKVTRLTDSEGVDAYPAWSPDGERIAYTHSNDARKVSRVFVMNADGTGVSKLTGKRRSSFLPTWSPNGGRIAFVRRVLCGKDRKRACGTALFVMDRDGSDKRRITPFNELAIMEYPDWSPNGKWIAYDRAGECCDATGIWLVRPNGNDRHRITNNEARHPAWSPSARKLVVDYGTDTENSDLWILGRRGRVLDRLTRGPAFDQDPSWSSAR